MGPVTTVLLVEDDAAIAGPLSRALGREGYDVAVVGDGPAALERAGESEVDLMVLDLGLPGMDGLEVCRRIRAKSTVPILMLTARGDETDRVVGLELGADDYLAKPFGPRELLARLRAVLRRVQPTAMAEKLEAHGVSLDVPAREARVNGRRVELTGLEFDLLVALVRRAGRVIPRDALLGEAGRGDTVVGERTVDVHISHLRQKLGEEGGKLIKTVRGLGYVFAREGP